MLGDEHLGDKRVVGAGVSSSPPTASGSGGSRIEHHQSSAPLLRQSRDSEKEDEEDEEDEAGEPPRQVKMHVRGKPSTGGQANNIS